MLEQMVCPFRQQTKLRPCLQKMYPNVIRHRKSSSTYFKTYHHSSQHIRFYRKDAIRGSLEGNHGQFRHWELVRPEERKYFCFISTSHSIILESYIAPRYCKIGHALSFRARWQLLKLDRLDSKRLREYPNPFQECCN